LNCKTTNRAKLSVVVVQIARLILLKITKTQIPCTSQINFLQSDITKINCSNMFYNCTLDCLTRAGMGDLCSLLPRAALITIYRERFAQTMAVNFI